MIFIYKFLEIIMLGMYGSSEISLWVYNAQYDRVYEKFSSLVAYACRFELRQYTDYIDSYA